MCCECMRWSGRDDTDHEPTCIKCPALTVHACVGRATRVLTNACVRNVCVGRAMMAMTTRYACKARWSGHDSPDHPRGSGDSGLYVYKLVLLYMFICFCIAIYAVLYIGVRTGNFLSQDVN